MRNKENILFNSWHSLYPNRKRNKKIKKEMCKLFDNLIELGYDKKLYIDSSLATIFIVNPQSKDMLYYSDKDDYIALTLNNSFFTIKEYQKNDSFLTSSSIYEDLSLEETTNMIIKLINRWLGDETKK